jgi:RNA polymerase sigma-70 factor (ECF subfamily)
VEDASAGAERDLGRIYLTQGARLWRSLLLFSGDPDVASDAVAEAFAQALAREAQLRDPASWVWRSAFRIATRELQARRRLTPLMSDPLAPDLPESLIDLRRALEQLTPHQRASVVLADYAGYPHAAIAKIIGSTAGAVAVHVHRGRRRLRSLLEVGDV